MKRRISAILAADIVGYSRLAAADEEDTVRRLAVCRKVFDEATAQHGGQVVNMVGDAILAQFPTSIDAIRCAINAQESNRIKNLDYPPSRKMNFRIGVTVGDIIDRDGQIFGESVNIAARLESLAPPGGICVSKTVYEHVVNDLSQRSGHRRTTCEEYSRPIHAYVIAPYQEGRADGPRTAEECGSAAEMPGDQGGACGRHGGRIDCDRIASFGSVRFRQGEAGVAVAIDARFAFLRVTNAPSAISLSRSACESACGWSIASAEVGTCRNACRCSARRRGRDAPARPRPVRNASAA